MCDDEPEEEEHTKVLPQIHHVLRDLPLFDNTYMNMQAVNIGLVDAHLEDLEIRLLAKYHEIEKTPLVEAMLVSAHSQLWIFGLYELLRTWRQEARELIAYGEDLAKLKDEARKARVQKEKARVTKVESGNVFGEGHYSRHFAQLETDPKFLEALKVAHARIESAFKKTELVRVTLAKHEVPKGGGVRAEAPGYGRIDMMNGSIYWDVASKDKTYEIISRRDIAIACKGI